jgi:HlyD family secretion protein
MNTRRSRAALAAAGIFLIGTLAGAGCGGRNKDAAQAKGHKPGVGDPGGSVPVQVATVQAGTIASSVPVTGNIQALADVQLSARAAGRVLAVNYREGQTVRAGQIVVQQDTTDLQANVRQAQANIAQAQANVASNVAKLSQAQTNYALQIQTARQAVAQARAQVSAANQNYRKVKGGSRPQQILQGRSQVLLAKANLDNAQTILTRNKNLFSQGAIAKADLDTAQTNYAVQVQTYQNAQQSLSLTQAGAQVEDVAASLAQLQQQQANLANAVANQQQVQVRRDDIVAAQAAVRQARAAVQTSQATLAFNQQQVANAFIRSPIDGIVAAREVEPGQVASPGTNLVRIVGLGTVYYEPTISETDFVGAHVGQPVSVQVDALPGKSYTGKVSAVYPAASAADRQFSLRVTVSNPSNELRPGMFARGSIVTRVARNVPLVPATALVPLASTQGFQPNTSSDEQVAAGTQTSAQQVVLVGPHGTAQPRAVKVGIQNQQQAQITGGLKAGDTIVIVGQQGLKAGDKLTLVDANGDPVGGPGGGHGRRTAQAMP